MAEFQMIVLTNPVEGCDAEYNRWYDEVHLRDVLAVPGVIGARRFRGVLPGEWKYAAIYRLDCEDPRAVMQEISVRWKTDMMLGSDAFDVSKFVMMMVEPIGQGLG